MTAAAPAIGCPLPTTTPPGLWHPFNFPWANGESSPTASPPTGASQTPSTSREVHIMTRNRTTGRFEADPLTTRNITIDQTAPTPTFEEVRARMDMWAWARDGQPVPVIQGRPVRTSRWSRLLRRIGGAA